MSSGICCCNEKLTNIEIIMPLLLLFFNWLYRSVVFITLGNTTQVNEEQIMRVIGIIMELHKRNLGYFVFRMEVCICG
jgi:hypothetical protein